MLTRKHSTKQCNCAITVMHIRDPSDPQIHHLLVLDDFGHMLPIEAPKACGQELVGSTNVFQFGKRSISLKVE